MDWSKVVYRIMAKITINQIEWCELVVLLMWRMLENPENIKSRPVRELIEDLDKQVKTKFYRAFLNINPLIRVFLKRIAKSIDATEKISSDTIEIKPSIEQDRKKEKKVATTLRKLFAQQEITKQDFQLLNEHYKFDLAFDNSFVKDNKIWLKYLESKE
jgi:hypothetical protein